MPHWTENLPEIGRAMTAKHTELRRIEAEIEKLDAIRDDLICDLNGMAQDEYTDEEIKRANPSGW